MWVLAAVALGFAAVLAIACDDDGGDKPSAVAAASDAECTNQATRTAIWNALTPGVPTPLPDTPEIPDNELQSRLRRALVRLADLPPGSAKSGFGTAFTDSPLACYLTPPRVRGYGSVGGDWIVPGDGADPDTGQIVRQSITLLGDGDGQRYLASLRRACNHDYQRGRIASVERSIADGIDALIAHEVQTSDSGGIEQKTVVTIQGDIVIATGVLSTSDIDGALAEDLTRRAVSRLDDIGPLPDEEPVLGEGCLPPDENDPELADALLQLDDLHYLTVEVPTGCGLIDLTFECDGERPRLPRDFKRRSSVAFVLGPAGVFPASGSASRVSEIALEYEGEPARELDGFFDGDITPVSCEAKSGDNTETVRIEPIDAPAIGERATAWRMTNPTASYDTVAFQRGSIVAVVMIPTDHRLAVGLLESADARLKAFVD